MDGDVLFAWIPLFAITFLKTKFYHKLLLLAIVNGFFHRCDPFAVENQPITKEYIAP